MRYCRESEGEVSIAEWRSVAMRMTACLYSAETQVEGMSTHDTIRYPVKKLASLHRSSHQICFDRFIYHILILIVHVFPQVEPRRMGLESFV